MLKWDNLGKNHVNTEELNSYNGILYILHNGSVLKELMKLRDGFLHSSRRNLTNYAWKHTYFSTEPSPGHDNNICI